MEKFNQLKLSDVHVHLIHTIAITTVILVHAAGRWPMTSQELNQLPPLGIASWTTVLIYQCLGVLGVPLFLMLTGLLLMHPEKMQIEKNESLRKFFKKRLTRIGLPFIFWTIIYFIWIHLTQNISLTPGVIIQGTLNGAYTQFWYIYALIGLYLLTPLLRVIIAHANKTPSQTLIKYFIGLWLIGASILPFFSLIFPYQLNHNVFTITGYVGYYVLGAYLCSIQPIDRKKALTLMLLGISLTALGTYVLMTSGAGTSMYYFQAYHSPTVILASVMAFLLLLTIKPTSHQQETTPPHQQEKLTLQQEKLTLQQEKLTLQQEKLTLQQETKISHQQEAKTALQQEKLTLQQEKLTLQQEKLTLQQEKLTLQQEKLTLQQETTPPHQQKTTPSILNKLITTIGQNTLGIFFVHVIVIETIQRGYLGFILNHKTLNPIIEVPLLTIITLFISLGIILLLKKMGLKKITGEAPEPRQYEVRNDKTSYKKMEI